MCKWLCSTFPPWIWFSWNHDLTQNDCISPRAILGKCRVRIHSIPKAFLLTKKILNPIGVEEPWVDWEAQWYCLLADLNETSYGRSNVLSGFLSDQIWTLLNFSILATCILLPGIEEIARTSSSLSSLVSLMSLTGLCLSEKMSTKTLVFLRTLMLASRRLGFLHWLLFW